MRYLFLLCLFTCILSSCRRMSHGPYKNYRISNDEAVPASQYGGAPYRLRR